MVSPQALLIAAAIAATLWGGTQAVKQTDKHVVKPVYHHVIQPIGRVAKKIHQAVHGK